MLSYTTSIFNYIFYYVVFVFVGYFVTGIVQATYECCVYHVFNEIPMRVHIETSAKEETLLWKQC